MILSAAYALYLYRRVVFGELVKPALQTIQDLTMREVVILAPLVVITILMGVYPKPIFDVTSASVANLIAQHRAAVAYDNAPPKIAAAQVQSTSPWPGLTRPPSRRAPARLNDSSAFADANALGGRLKSGHGENR